MSDAPEPQQPPEPPIVEDASEQDVRTALAALRAQAQAKVARPQLEGGQEVVCRSCGGRTTFAGAPTPARCPTCATPIQRDDVHDAPARLPVDRVLPFQVDEQHARAALEKWINRRWFAPSELKGYEQTGSFTSVYAACFGYDADAVTWYEGRRGEEYTATEGSGDDRRTETRVRWFDVDGQVRDRFDGLCVLAIDGFERDQVAALEPWPTAAAKPFSAEYLAGHLVRTYDRDVEQCFGEAKARMDGAIEASITRDIGGDRQQIRHRSTSFQTLTFEHLLLPIWLLTVTVEGRPFHVFVDGVTGEVHGRRPLSKAKLALAIAVVVAAAVAVLLAVL